MDTTNTTPRTVTAHVDLTAPGRGIILVTGTVLRESPQALLGRDGKRFYVEDAEHGIMIYRTVRDAAVRAYLKSLSLLPELAFDSFDHKTVEIIVYRDY